MKKALLIISVLTIACHVKAQQTSNVQSLTLPKSDLKIDTSLFFRQFKARQFLLPKIDNQVLLAQLLPLNNSGSFYSKMPVLKTDLNIDRMPVLTPGKPGEKYPMLIKRINQVEANTTNNIQNP